MHATTTYVHPDQLDALARRSEDGTPAAWHVREALDRYLYPDGVPPEAEAARKAAAQRSGRGRGAERGRQVAAVRADVARRLAAEGLPSLAIAGRLRVTVETVRKYLEEAE